MVMLSHRAVRLQGGAQVRVALYRANLANPTSGFLGTIHTCRITVFDVLHRVLIGISLHAGCWHFSKQTRVVYARRIMTFLRFLLENGNVQQETIVDGFAGFRTRPVLFTNAFTSPRPSSHQYLQSAKMSCSANLIAT